MTQVIEVVFDTETTGLIKPSANDIKDQPYITEIYCYKQVREGNRIEIIGEFDSLVKPPIVISDEITRITGITNEMLERAPSFKQIAPDLAEFFVGVNRFVAHNLPFDKSMLANELLRCDRVLKFPWPTTHVCTVEKSMHYEQRRLTLTRLHEFLFATGFPNAHRAKNDVIPLVRCYNEMISRGDIL
jgi:DNA polymerase III epsilon subunit-like protein